MRRYSLSENGEGSPVPGDKPATVCPLRFLENGTVFRWVAEKMLGTREPILVKEMPFLRKVQTNSEATPPADDEDSRRAGRIDWILVDPTSVGSSDLKWCALETQGLYFSGTNWKQEFKAFAENGDSIHFPKGQRRPDYRSNGPKRLAPQLSVKVPVLRAWGKKVAVVVDGYFFDQMAEIKPSFRTARTEQDRLDQAEVVWFVVNYDAKMQLTPGNVFYSDLDKSMEALNATEPIERGLFQRGLKTVLGDSTRHGSKVFRLTDA